MVSIEDIDTLSFIWKDEFFYVIGIVSSVVFLMYCKCIRRSLLRAILAE